MDIRQMRTQLGETQSEFAARYNIPFRTVQNWETGIRKPPEYIVNLLNQRISYDIINRKTTQIPEYEAKKLNLPKRSDYLGAISWLKAVKECLGDSVVFALDQSLMCQGKFGGRSDEYVVWVYGDDSVTRYNGVVLLGNYVTPRHVKEKNGLNYTDFNRTIYDAFSNEDILDMQGMTEAVSKYYYSNGESFDGIFIVPEHQEKFEKLAQEAIEYYGS